MLYYNSLQCHSKFLFEFRKKSSTIFYPEENSLLYRPPKHCFLIIHYKYVSSIQFDAKERIQPACSCQLTSLWQLAISLATRGGLTASTWHP